MSDFEDMWLQEANQSYFSKVAQVEARVCGINSSINSGDL